MNDTVMIAGRGPNGTPRAIEVDANGNLLVGGGGAGANVAQEAGGNLATLVADLTTLLARLPAALAAGGGLKIEGVAGGVTVPVTADTELPAASAINGTILKSVSAPVVGAALLVSDNTNLIQPLGDAANGLDVDVTRSALPAGAATSALQGAGLPAALGAGGGLKVDGSGTALPVVPTGATPTAATPTQIIKTVAATATPEALAADNSFFVTALIGGLKAARTANAGVVYLGIGATNDTQPFAINPGEWLTINAPAGQKYDLNDWYLDVLNAGDGVAVIYS